MRVHVFEEVDVAIAIQQAVERLEGTKYARMFQI